MYFQILHDVSGWVVRQLAHNNHTWLVTRHLHISVSLCLQWKRQSIQFLQMVVSSARMVLQRPSIQLLNSGWHNKPLNQDLSNATMLSRGPGVSGGMGAIRNSTIACKPLRFSLFFSRLLLFGRCIYTESLALASSRGLAYIKVLVCYVSR